MSSMVRTTTSLLMLSMAAFSIPAYCQTQHPNSASQWDQARAQLLASPQTSMAQAVERWQTLSTSDRFSFDNYSSFLLTYPDFPDEEKVRSYAERALARESVDAGQIIAFFDRYPPRANPARAQYAIALNSLRRPEAQAVALSAWRGGAMSDAAAQTLLSAFGSQFSTADHDARMNALLWDGNIAQAQQQLPWVSPTARTIFNARLALLQGNDPASLGLVVPQEAERDHGYVYNRVRQARRLNNTQSAINTLANRPQASTLPHNSEKWVTELLQVARLADSENAVRIASSIDDAFPQGTDISAMSFRLRDDYTSLMWLGGTKALDNLGSPQRAAPLFYRYGAAAKTPQTRTKGFYWAGRAASQAGNTSEANRYFGLAAEYPDSYYGQLSLERLGRPIPNLNQRPTAQISAEERARFYARPITAAAKHVAINSEWKTTVRFFRAIAESANSQADYLLLDEFARSIGRRDLAVILGQDAQTKGFNNFQAIAFPLINNPAGTDWTIVHAITRQESQFAQNALSHAGARGLMQLMPGTAREQAGIIGLSYNMGSLHSDPDYNMRLGDSYFARMLRYYRGSYPLAIAAYNAGPGNVNRFIQRNGDPRDGTIDWVQWVERIPISETRTYVQRVLENAVTYEALYPDKAQKRTSAPISSFMGKRTPG